MTMSATVLPVVNARIVLKYAHVAIVGDIQVACRVHNRTFCRAEAGWCRPERADEVKLGCPNTMSGMVSPLPAQRSP